ncbi:MAG: hypothetical protein ACD_2C00039G0003 [uncultured bacterium (gcode 4)]|uniref:Uncharacterized protein n=1 Tax=uncultured bacterium (gcode 4) TaxID=1234023 RepID=K2GI46_9BACT|nr:MAG: hypothetical protein ACD_2C00039G0003 [uncultured bacterium (gcode 4)]
MKPQNSIEVLEWIILEWKEPILNKSSFRILWIYLVSILVIWIALITRVWILYIIIWMWLLWWAAHMLQNIYNSIKKEDSFRMIAKNYKLFPSPEACIDYLYLNNLIFWRYKEDWKIWVYLQPVLSIISWMVTYFVLRSLIQISLWGNITWEPNVFFYGFFAFISWFFYEKFLDYLNDISQRISKTKYLNEEIFSKIKDFDNSKAKVSLRVRNELEK